VKNRIGKKEVSGNFNTGEGRGRYACVYDRGGGDLMRRGHLELIDVGGPREENNKSTELNLRGHDYPL